MLTCYHVMCNNVTLSFLKTNVNFTLLDLGKLIIGFIIIGIIWNRLLFMQSKRWLYKIQSKISAIIESFCPFYSFIYGVSGPNRSPKQPYARGKCPPRPHLPHRRLHQRQHRLPLLLLPLTCLLVMVICSLITGHHFVLSDGIQIMLTLITRAQIICVFLRVYSEVLTSSFNENGKIVSMGNVRIPWY